MKEIIRAANYVLHADIAPVVASQGQFSFALLSQQLDAKNPAELRRLVQFTCDKQTLQALADQIQQVTKHPEQGGVHA